MSENKFVNFGKHIINLKDVRGIFETTEKIEVERKIAVIKYDDGNTEKVILAEGENLRDFFEVHRFN